MWRVAVHNGQEMASSVVYSFSTRLSDCSSVLCDNGDCNEETLECVCDYGYSGPSCSIKDKTNGLVRTCYC